MQLDVLTLSNTVLSAMSTHECAVVFKYANKCAIYVFYIIIFVRSSNVS